MAEINPPLFSLQMAIASLYLSNQPVVPETTGTLCLKQFVMFLKAEEGNAKVYGNVCC